MIYNRGDTQRQEQRSQINPEFGDDNSDENRMRGSDESLYDSRSARQPSKKCNQRIINLLLNPRKHLVRVRVFLV